MATLTRSARWSSERGAELIEMVVVLPLLLLVIFGIVDFGFMFQRYVVLTNAAMEGARVGILPGYTYEDAKLRAEAYATTGGAPGAVAAVDTVSLVEPDGAMWPAVEVTVTLPYTYEFIGPIASMFGSSFGSVNLTARSTMRHQLGGS